VWIDNRRSGSGGRISVPQAASVRTTTRDIRMPHDRKTDVTKQDTER